MPNNCPVIHVNPDLDYDKLDLKVESINVLKPIKKGGEATKNGYTLKIQFSYNFGNKNYKCDSLRVRFDSGKIKRVGTGPNGYDLSSFTIIEESSPSYQFLKRLHDTVSDYLVENVTRIQPNIYVQTMLNFDEEFGDKFNKKNKNSAEIVSELKNHCETFDEDKKKNFNKALSKSVRDTFRFHRKKNQDWCLLKPSTMSEECYNMGLTVYKPKELAGKSDSVAYDIKVYEVGKTDGRMVRMLEPHEVEESVGGASDKKGMVDYEHLIIELKNPHMNASEEAVSFGFVIRYVGISSVEEEEFDPITNTFVSKTEALKKRKIDDKEDIPTETESKKIKTSSEEEEGCPDFLTQVPQNTPEEQEKDKDGQPENVSEDDAEIAADQDAAYD